MGQPAYKTFPLPPKIALPSIPSPEDAKRQLDAILDDAFEHAQEKLHHGFKKLGKDQVDRLQKQAEEEGVAKAYDYLRTKMTFMTLFYTGYRTGLMTMTDDATGRDVTTGCISNILTDLAESIGPRTTEQIYRAISSSVDEVLQERYGKVR